jgi:hypothetical protein
MTKAERKSIATKLAELERLIAASSSRMSPGGAAYKVLVPGWARSVLSRAADELDSE